MFIGFNRVTLHKVSPGKLPVGTHRNLTMNHTFPLIYAVAEAGAGCQHFRDLFAQHFPGVVTRSFDSGGSLVTYLTHRLDGRLPELILIQGEMTLFSTAELRRYLRNDPDLRHIPVVSIAGISPDEFLERCGEEDPFTYLSQQEDYGIFTTPSAHQERPSEKLSSPLTKVAHPASSDCTEELGRRPLFLN